MKILTIIAAIVLVLHGLIHLMGTAAYLKLAVIPQLPYKTTVLDGRWELGASGIAVYGGLWAIAAIGFIVAAVALLASWNWWQPLLIVVTLLSLALTALDWGVAYTGVIVNIVILGILWLGPRLSGWVSR